ncbi:MAG: GTPase HflX [Candidatus Loosdrechtia sp.]|uniref:HflX GTPase family protein n=1 Tax=Candidatus Loosdrechtia sp. TaxID=3101272 RepID=UPI003A6FE581|nr:MAG: GTPase HflX [Candidatus Jettenia sp. AMX2]
MKLKDTAFTVRTERAIPFCVITPGSCHRSEIPLEELQRLTETAGASVVHTLFQNRVSIDPVYYLGKGKALELSKIADELNADVLICDDNLTPAQVRNLEKITGKKVIDRSELILDIFATRAKTFQAKLQVELAQLEYTRPRLKRMWTHLSRIEGGIGTRGPGEKQLEVDKRIISKKIQHLKKKLNEIEKRQERLVISRKEFFTVSIVGYTNAGKSTLMNVLTDAGTLVEDKLFATLDTKTGLCILENGERILVSDTVGFIQKLPHHLIASFKATLEEARNADLLLHVVDISAPEVQKHIDAVNTVLKELGCDQKPVIMVFNKMDALKDESVIPLLKNQYDDSVLIAAKTSYGIPDLKRRIREIIELEFVDIELSCSSGSGKLISYLYEHANIISSQFDEKRVFFRLCVDRRLLRKLCAMDNDVQIHETVPHEGHLKCKSDLKVKL